MKETTLIEKRTTVLKVSRQQISLQEDYMVLAAENVNEDVSGARISYFLSGGWCPDLK
jgi:hypothetical protein